MQRRKFLASALFGTSSAILPATSDASPAPLGEPELTAQTTEGPYYLPLNLTRADITEGLKGIPLDIVFHIQDTDGRPSAGAIVDVWHCDAEGRYSGFDQPGGIRLKGQSFLRGCQSVDGYGRASFHSIYPGWYRGRTTHIHFKVRRGNLTNVTSQFFLPDTLSEYLYTQVPAYQRTELRDTLNSTDGIAIEAGNTVHANVREDQGRYLVTLSVRVDPLANPSVDRPPAPGGPGDGVGAPPPSSPAGPPPFAAAPTGAARTEALLPTAKRDTSHTNGARRHLAKANALNSVQTLRRICIFLPGSCLARIQNHDYCLGIDLKETSATSIWNTDAVREAPLKINAVNFMNITPAFV